MAGTIEPAIATPATVQDAPKAPVTAPPVEGKPAEGSFSVKDIKLPEGFTLNDKVASDFVSLMNDTKLSVAERAQKLVDLQVGLMKEASEAGSRAWDDLQEQWKQQVQNHPDVGGDKLAASLSNIQRLIGQYGGPAESQAALKEALDLTGAGNNPAVIVFLSRVANELVKEGTPVTGSAPASKEGTTLAQRLFPNLQSTG